MDEVPMWVQIAIVAAVVLTAVLRRNTPEPPPPRPDPDAAPSSHWNRLAFAQQDLISIQARVQGLDTPILGEIGAGTAFGLYLMQSESSLPAGTSVSGWLITSGVLLGLGLLVLVFGVAFFRPKGTKIRAFEDSLSEGERQALQEGILALTRLATLNEGREFWKHWCQQAGLFLMGASVVVYVATGMLKWR